MSGRVWVGSRIVEPTNSRNVQFTGASSASNIPSIVPTRIGTLLTTLLRTRSPIVYRMSAGKSSVLPSPNPSRRNTPNTNIVPKVLDRYQLVQVPPKQITPLLFPMPKYQHVPLYGYRYTSLLHQMKYTRVSLALQKPQSQTSSNMRMPLP